MDNEIVYSSKATDQKAQYDASAKRLLEIGRASCRERV